MGVFGKVMAWGHRKGLEGIENQIHKIVYDGRLQFLSDDKVLYIDKRGKKAKYTFGQFATEAIVIGGWEKQMIDLGLTVHDVKDIIIKEYEKQKGGTQ